MDRSKGSKLPRMIGVRIVENTIRESSITARTTKYERFQDDAGMAHKWTQGNYKRQKSFLQKMNILSKWGEQKEHKLWQQKCKLITGGGGERLNEWLKTERQTMKTYWNTSKAGNWSERLLEH